MQFCLCNWRYFLLSSPTTVWKHDYLKNMNKKCKQPRKTPEFTTYSYNENAAKNVRKGELDLKSAENVNNMC